MSNISIEQIKDTITHKKIVLDAGFKISKYFFENSQIDLGIKILQRVAVHDNSKFSRKELESLSEIYKSDECFKNAKYTLSEKEKNNIELHWRHNSHHPEHFKDIEDMSKVDVVEMVCDWYARSIQYKTDLIDFIKTRQVTRFNFPEHIWEEILYYANILLQEVVHE